MFGLYMLAIYLGVAVIAAGFVALLVVVALAVGLVTHPIRTLALVFHKLAPCGSARKVAHFESWPSMER